MTLKRQYTPIKAFDLDIDTGLFITFSDGKELHFEIDEYIDWLNETQDLSDYEEDMGDYYDDGEGSYTFCKTLDWSTVLDNFKTMELVRSFYKTQPNIILA